MNKKIIFSLATIAAALTIGSATNNPVKAATTSVEPVYRLYNPNTGEHFYTESVAEETSLSQGGWQYEGIGWQSATDTGTPVYRVYNPNAQGGDHYYTINKNEAAQLVSLGWRWDNNANPVFYSAGSTNLYVAYNPNASSGAHNYTTSTGEQNNLLSVGWEYGAVAWNVEGPGDPNYPNPAPSAPSAPVSPTGPRQVDVNVTGAGGSVVNNPGSFRYLYSSKAFDTTPTGTPTIDVSADISMNGSAEGSELQFIVAGSDNPGGQIGIELHNETSGSAAPYWKAGINVATVNFPQNAGTSGQQFYSSDTNFPAIAQGQTVHAEIKYYASGSMQVYLNNTLVGQYNTLLTGQLFVVHASASLSTISVANLTVLKNGVAEGPQNGTSTGQVTGNGVLY